MNTRRRQLIACGLSLATLAAFQNNLQAAVSTKPLRIFMILYRGETEVEKGFRDYFSTRNIAVELIVRDVAQDASKVPALVAEARQLKVDLIYTWGTPVTVATVGSNGNVDPARHVTDIPVVFTMVASPAAAGLISNGTSSGRNVTGTSHVVPIEQQLSAIRTYRPLSSMAVIFNPAESNSVRVVKDLRDASKKDGFRLMELPVPLGADKKPIEEALPQLISRAAKAGNQFLYMGPDSFVGGAQRKAITEEALSLGLPTFSATESPLRDALALFGLVSGYENLGRLAGYKVDQILLRKIRPQDVPVETLARFSYIVNMRVAAQLKFYPPLKVVNFAEIIQ